MPPYKSATVDCDVDFDTTLVRGKTVVVTGGANGIGEAYVRGLVRAGGYVAIGDVDTNGGERLASEYPDSVRYVKCDVTKWSDQLLLFEAACSLSPSKIINVVIANAGVGAGDSISHDAASLKEIPDEPDLVTTKVNLVGVLYTVKLALHYFHRQHAQDSQVDQVLILGGSMAGYLNTPGALEYGVSKFALRSLMRNLRLTEWQRNVRVTFIGPWFVATNILSPGITGYLKSKGAQFATVEDATTAVLRIIADKSIAGRSFAILPRTLAARGYLDVDSDDPANGTLLNKLQLEYDRSIGMDVTQ